MHSHECLLVTFTFCCDNLWKSKFMALEKPAKLGIFFFYFVATLFPYTDTHGSERNERFRAGCVGRSEKAHSKCSE